MTIICVRSSTGGCQRRAFSILGRAHALPSDYAATGAYKDIVKAGVIDPAKVVRTALQNAASITSLAEAGFEPISADPRN
jgi:hypothetical protein